MSSHPPFTRFFSAVLVLFAAAQSALAAGEAPSPSDEEIDDRPTIEVFGKRPGAGITPELLERLGGVEGTRDWVGVMVDNLRLAVPLRKKLARFETDRQRAELNELLVNTMLGRPPGVDKSLVDTVASLELTSEEFNVVVESVLETCEDTHLSYRDCNRILASMQPVGLYARGF